MDIDDQPNPKLLNFRACGGARVLLVSTRSGIPLELVKFNLIQAREVLCDKERTGNPPPGGSTHTAADPTEYDHTLHNCSLSS